MTMRLNQVFPQASGLLLALLVASGVFLAGPGAAGESAAGADTGAVRPSAAPARTTPVAVERTLHEALPGLWVGGEVPVERMPGWPGAPVSDASPGAGADAGPDAAPAARRLFTIIDLRPSGESPLVAAERAAAAAAGVGYLSIPVSRDGAPPASAVAQLEAVLRNAEGAPVVLHCVSGNRAGDLLARYLIRNGMDVDSAIAKGREAGLGAQREAAIRGGVLGHP
jgi:uncharacterized protein (TIGR01244 family)